MKTIAVRLSDEMAQKLGTLSRKYELRGLEETLRFSAHFTLLTIERMEQRRGKQLALTTSPGSQK